MARMRPGRVSAVTSWILLSLFAASAPLQAQIVVRVGLPAASAPIPDDFCGLSFESSNLLPDENGKYLFNDENLELIALFRAIGIRNLRIGGGTADMAEYRVPETQDIDQLFAFAKAADVKVIYTLRLLNGNAKEDAGIARYIQERYARWLVCFEIGNEPDWHSFHSFPGHARDPRIVETGSGNSGSAFPSYLADWRDFESAIVDQAPMATFTGPDTGSNHPVPGTKDTDFDGQSWTQRFAHALKDSGRLAFVAQHDYVGQNAAGVRVPTAIASMLSRDWVESRYPLLFDHVLGPVQKEGLSYRMTEANDYTGGVDGASNAFASALWALDYLHWHAAHHAVGVNFHNKRWIFTDTILPDRSGHFHLAPKAYAIKAFEVGAHGSPEPVSLENRDKVNLTAYAVAGQKELYVTLINKGYGPGAREAAVTIFAPKISGPVEGMFLSAPDGNVRARAGITFGDAEITTEGWAGKWRELGEGRQGKAVLKLPGATAVVVKLNRN